MKIMIICSRRQKKNVSKSWEMDICDCFWTGVLKVSVLKHMLIRSPDFPLVKL